MALAGMIGITACQKDDEPEFDRKAMLENMASSVIIPQYETLNTTISALHTEATEFTANPTLATLGELRAQYILACRDFLYCGMYNFGPAMDYGIKAAFNTFPVDTAKIEANISAGSYVLGSAANTTAIGLPAMDYLLYFGSDAEILGRFTAATTSPGRKTYLVDLVAKMKDEFQLTLNKWSSYKAEFLVADGNDVASSCSYLLNELVKDIELLKNARVGIPAGQQTGGATMPEMAEAYYSGKSIEFAKYQLHGIRLAFTGGAGIGFDDYIRDVEGDEVETSLADNIISQIDVCTAKLNALAGPLSNDVDANAAGVNELYLELKKLVVYCKTDMTSMLGILITYQDNDGD